MKNFIDNLDNRMNPIVVKELRQGFQSLFIVILVNLLLTALTLTCIFTMGYMPNDPSAPGISGREAFFFLQVVLLVTTIFLIPGYVGIRLYKERGKQQFRKGTVVCADLLFITSMKANQIIRGKFFTGMIFTTLIYSLCLPFMLFTSFVNGYDVPTMLFSLSVCYVVSMPIMMLAIFTGAIRGGILIFFYCYGGFLSTVGISVLSQQILRQGVYGFLRQEGIIWMIGLSLLSIFLGIKIIGAMSIGILSPVASDRTRRLRVWMMISILTWGLAIAGYWGFEMLHAHGTIFSGQFLTLASSWADTSMILTLLMLSIAINEPDGFSNRIMNERPRRFLWRLFRFPLTHGASSGFTWVAVIATLIFGVAATIFSIEHYSASSGPLAAGPSLAPGVTLGSWATVNMRIAFFLIMVAYMLTAKVIMRALFPHEKPKHTWGVLIFLIPGALLVAWLVCFMLNPNAWDTMLFWRVVNPFAGNWNWHTPLPAASRLWAITIWISIMILLCLPRGLRDAKRYLFEKST